jgi:hypothetical protein
MCPLRFDPGVGILLQLLPTRGLKNLKVPARPLLQGACQCLWTK